MPLLRGFSDELLRQDRDRGAARTSPQYVCAHWLHPACSPRLSPDNLAVAPAIVIIPGDDTIGYGASNRQITLTLNVTLYLTPQADLSRKYADLMVWRSWLRDSLIDGVTLDATSGVTQASVVSTVIGTDTWADQDFLTISATVEVAAVEAISTSA